MNLFETILFYKKKIIPVAGPKIMGDKVPAQALYPFKKQTQRKIVKYHNYFRSIVEPPAANMLMMVII